MRVNTPRNTRSYPDPITFATQHPTLVLALVSSAVVIFRALIWGDLRVATALALLTAGGIGGVILGSALAYLPFIVPLAGILSFVRLRSAPRLPDGSALRAALDWVVVTAGFLTFVMTPLFVVGFMAIMLVFIWFAADDGPQYMLGLLAGAVLSGVVFGPFWLPSERISIGSETFTGYVLGQSAGWTEILRPGRQFDGRVVIVRDSEITQRVVCAEANAATLTAFEALGTVSEKLLGVALSVPLPPCPAR
jgi:hypothetical protein